MKKIKITHVWHTDENAGSRDRFFATDKEAFKYLLEVHGVDVTTMKWMGKTSILEARGHPAGVRMTGLAVPATAKGIAKLLDSLFEGQQ